MLNMSSVDDVFSRNFPKMFRAAILKETLLMDVPYFIKEHLWTNASDQATLKKIFGGSKPSWKLTLKTKWYHSCGCYDDTRSCEQNYFEKSQRLISFIYNLKILNKYNFLPESHLASSGKSRVFNAGIKSILTNF